MTAILLLMILFLTYTNLCFMRYIWFLDIYGKYVAAVHYYLILHNMSLDKAHPEYLEMWPVRYIIRKFFTWDLRAFAVHQDKYDEVIDFVLAQKNTVKSE